MVFNFRDFEGLLANIYAKHEDDNDAHAIFVLIEKGEEEKYSRVVARLKFLDNYESELEATDDYGLFKLEVPKSMRASYDKICQGKFSKLNEEYKNQIFDVNNLMVGSKPDMSTKMYKILYRHPLYKQALEKELQVTIEDGAELRDKPDLTGRECFRLSYIK